MPGISPRFPGKVPMERPEVHQPATEPADVRPSGDPATAGSRRLQLALWAILSVAFLGYLAFGSVNARIWRITQVGGSSRWELEVDSKSIAGIWDVQGQELPDVAYQWMLQAVFYGAIAVFVVCVIAGMRLLLADAPDATASSTAGADPQ